MRIVVYPHSLSIGGSQLNAVELAASVRDRGHEVIVFAAEPGPLQSFIEELRLPLVLAPRHKRRPSIFIARTLRELCHRERIDLVHGYEWPPCLEGFYGPLLLDGVPVACTVMSMSVAPFIPPLVPLVVGTEQIAAAARENRAGTVDVIEPPVDTEANHPGIDGASFRAQHLLGQQLTVVLVSRLAYALKLEGLERAIKAIELLGRTDVRLVIVGDGPAREQLERAASDVNAHLGGTCIVFTGELTDPRPAYAAADVVLGMGGSALRAMAFAKPVVVLGERGFAKLLEPTSSDTFLWQGFYGIGKDEPVRDLAEGLRLLLSDADRRIELGAFSRRLVESRFSLRSAGDKQIGLYERWISAARHPRSKVFVAAAQTAAQLFVHKTRVRLNRLRSRSASEDFNTVAQIEKVARLASKTPSEATKG